MPLLNDTKIKNLQPKDKLYRIYDGQGYGLYLEVLPNGGKKWRLKYRYGGRYKCISLGGYPETSLKAAGPGLWIRKGFWSPVRTRWPNVTTPSPVP